MTYRKSQEKTKSELEKPNKTEIILPIRKSTFRTRIRSIKKDFHRSGHLEIMQMKLFMVLLFTGRTRNIVPFRENRREENGHSARRIGPVRASCLPTCLVLSEGTCQASGGLLLRKKK